MRNIASLVTALVLSFSAVAATGCATFGSDEEYSDVDGEAAAPGQFDLWQSSDSQFRFHLVAGNKNILLTSEGYTTRTNAIGGVLSVMANAVDPAQYELAQATNGKYFLRLHAANGQLIGFTQLYSSKSSAKRAITSCVRAVTSYLDKVYGTGNRAHVTVTEDADGKFSFSVFAQNGEAVVTSHAYASEASALNGAFAIQEAAALTSAYKVVEGASGYYFTATALNGAVVATSPAFATSEGAAAALAAAKTLMPTIDVL